MVPWVDYLLKKMFCTKNLELMKEDRRITTGHLSNEKNWSIFIFIFKKGFSSLVQGHYSIYILL